MDSDLQFPEETIELMPGLSGIRVGLHSGSRGACQRNKCLLVGRVAFCFPQHINVLGWSSGYHGAFRLSGTKKDSTRFKF